MIEYRYMNIYSNNTDITDMLDFILSAIMAEDKNWRREYGSVHMKKERRYAMFVDISCIAELAVVYNVGVIFKKVIQLFSDASYVSWNECRIYRETLLELCCVFKRRNFQELLLGHECQELHKESTSEASTFALLYRLLIEYTLQEHHGTAAKYSQTHQCSV